MPKIYKENLLDSHELLVAPHILDSPSNTGSDSKEDPLRMLITWSALSRPYRKKDRSYFTTVAVLIALFSPIALFLGGKTLFLALLALGFVVYVFNLVPPEEIEYRISAQGITIGDHFYHWKELDSFWMSHKDGQAVLNILTRYSFPGVLMLIVDSQKQEEIKRVCAKYLPFHEIVPKTLIEKWVEAMQKYFPLENPNR